MFIQGTLGLTFEDVQCSRLITVTSTVASCKPAMLMLCMMLWVRYWLLLEIQVQLLLVLSLLLCHCCWYWCWNCPLEVNWDSSTEVLWWSPEGCIVGCGMLCSRVVLEQLYQRWRLQVSNTDCNILASICHIQCDKDWLKHVHRWVEFYKCTGVHSFPSHKYYNI